MPEKPVKVRPLWRWAFWRVWCVVALPWLVAAVGYGGYVAAQYKPLIAAEVTRDGRDLFAYTSVKVDVQVVERLLSSLVAMQPQSSSGYDIRQAAPAIAVMNEKPNIWAASVWSASRTAMWIYREKAKSPWSVVTEPIDPLQPASLHEVKGRFQDSPVGPTTVPIEWRIRGQLYEKAVEQLHENEQKKADMPLHAPTGIAWKYFKALPHVDWYECSGFVAMLVARDADGGIRGAYCEVFSLGGTHDISFGWDDRTDTPVTLLARVLEDGKIAPIKTGKLEPVCTFFDEPLPKQTPLYDLERLLDPDGFRVTPDFITMRGYIGDVPCWLVGSKFDHVVGEPLFLGAFLRESEVIVPILRPATYCLGIFVLTTFLLALAHWRILGGFAQTLMRDMGEVRRLDVLRGPYYFPKTRIAELAALREAVEEAAAGLDKREAAVKDPVMLEAVVRAVPVEREGGEGGGPTQNVPLAPPVAFVQAMDMVRRQLGDAKRELEALRAVQVRPGADPGAELVLAERLLAGLRNHTVAMAIGDTLAAGLGTREARLYVVKEEFTRFFAEDGAGGGGFLPVELARAGHPLLFLALERMKVLWIDDAGADPRCARLFAGQKLVEPLSMVALLVNEGKGVWIAVRPRGASGWRAAEQVFAEAIARQSVVARVEETKSAETPVVYPPGGAHALWAQPNLPANPDKPMFREMVDSAAAGMFTLSRAGRFTYLNSAAEQLFGMAGGALLGQALIERAAAGEEGAVQSALQRVLSGAALEERDIHFRRVAGGAVLMRLYLAPLQDEGGEPTGITGCVLDVTALRERELVLSRQEAVYRGIVEGAPQLLWSMDAIGCITFVNGVCAQIYGMSPEEIIGRPSTILCDTETAARDVERMALLMAGRACTGYRTTHRHKDGTPVPLVVVAARQVDGAGNVTGAVGLAIALGGEEGA